jgi:hypothetical protein
MRISLLPLRPVDLTELRSLAVSGIELIEVIVQRNDTLDRIFPVMSV